MRTAKRIAAFTPPQRQDDPPAPGSARRKRFRDLILNVILFIPFGVLIGAWLGRRAGEGAWRAILLLAAISASFEMLQLFIPVRFTSIDVIANTLGGALGALLMRWLSASAAAAAARADA